MTWPLVSLELLFIYCLKKVAAAKAALSLLICLFSSHKKMVTATKYPDASNRRQIFQDSTCKEGSKREESRALVSHKKYLSIFIMAGQLSSVEPLWGFCTIRVHTGYFYQT